jgi:hypothetical protein
MREIRGVSSISAATGIPDRGVGGACLGRLVGRNCCGNCFGRFRRKAVTRQDARKITLVGISKAEGVNRRACNGRGRIRTGAFEWADAPAQKAQVIKDIITYGRDGIEPPNFGAAPSLAESAIEGSPVAPATWPESLLKTHSERWRPIFGVMHNTALDAAMR